MIRTALIAGSLIFAVQAHAQDWRVMEVGSKAEALSMMDVSTINRDAKPFPTARVMMVSAEDRGRIAGVNALVEFDCPGHRWHMLDGVAFDAQGQEIDRVGASPDWEDARPGSLFGEAQAYFCEGKTNGRFAVLAGQDTPVLSAREVIAHYRDVLAERH